ncbi:PREDICTED: uncharacterized protein LOC105965414 [Erythranthe guttata]|uniref:uncharacterized protein LOC105965414 n=1 Tax=Erythranthe guttata TaxID=4155 RepID=UPI00064DD110|nr:PREDICTED: uncharacterized protein LOC105965414 [Erythranthe guttata]|eukprot:XP_012845410.1 PREDICTED: uncharacterized protein LOC105965414 [Erythranthe guttata]
MLIHWEAPPRDVLKINFDASLGSDENSCGLGGLARSFDGKCVVWFSSCCNQRLDATTAEAMAALRAMEFARDHDMHRVILESDSSTIVAAIQGEGGYFFSFGHLIDDIKRLSSVFKDFKVCHVKKEGNRAAYEIAKLSLRSTFTADVFPRFHI